MQASLLCFFYIYFRLFSSDVGCRFYVFGIPSSFLWQSVKKLLLGFVILLQALITVNISEEPSCLMSHTSCHLQTISSGLMNYIRADLSFFYFGNGFSVLSFIYIFKCLYRLLSTIQGKIIYQAQNWLNFEFFDCSLAM